MPDDITDRRVRARMSCRYGDCFWTVQADSATEMDRLWAEHSAEHWGIDPTALLPQPTAADPMRASDEQASPLPTPEADAHA